MALRTGHSQMRAGQREARFLVARQREVRRMKLLHAVALFAAILIGRGRELAFVGVFVATAALCLRDPKQRRFALGRVALLAFHFGVTALERV